MKHTRVQRQLAERLRSTKKVPKRKRGSECGFCTRVRRLFSRVRRVVVGFRGS